MKAKRKRILIYEIIAIVILVIIWLIARDVMRCNIKNVRMEVIPETVTPTGATVRIINDNDDEIYSGEYYIIEQKINNYWVKAKVKGEESFYMIAKIIGKHSTNIENITWDDIYGELGKGEYRIIKVFNNSMGKIGVSVVPKAYFRIE